MQLIEVSGVCSVARGGGSIIFASAVLDASIGRFAGVEQMFFGCRSNEARLLSLEHAEVLSITNDVYIFPWEKEDEQ